MKVLEIVKDFVSGKICDFRLRSVRFYNYSGDKKRFKELRRYLIVLPDNIIKLMKKTGLEIVYSKPDILASLEDVAGFYNREHNQIVIYDYGEGNFGWQVITLIHEVGHFVDYTLGFSDSLSGRKSYRSNLDFDCHQAFVKEQEYFDKYAEHGNYYQSNIIEFFAQSFAEYYLYHEFKENCPLTSTYIERKISEIA